MLLTIIAFIFVLGILILVHELGHFLAAKWSGVKVLEFSIGFPPRLLSFKKGETKYTIGSLPLGGYVKMLGEEEVSNDPQAFNRQSSSKRLVISVAGVLMNLVLAWLILSIGFAIGMTPLVSSPDKIPGKRLETNVYITEVVKDSPAAASGIEPGDILVGAKESGSDTTFDSAEEAGAFTKKNAGREVTVILERNSETITKDVLLSTSESPLGVGLYDQSVIRVPWYRAPAVAVAETFRMIGFMYSFLQDFFGRLFSTGQISEDVGGPVAIFSMSGAAARAGWMVLFQFVAILSVNLAIINILPFPALDGGRLLFILLEKIFGRRVVKEEVENIIHTIGFILLILLILAITYKDILRLIGR